MARWQPASARSIRVVEEARPFAGWNGGLGQRTIEAVATLLDRSVEGEPAGNEQAERCAKGCELGHHIERDRERSRGVRTTCTAPS